MKKSFMICAILLIAAVTAFTPNISAAKQFLRGDANGSGYVSIIDVTTIQRVLAEMGTLPTDNFTVADVDKDGVISINDATIIQQYLAEYENDCRVGYYPAASPPSYWQEEVDDCIAKINALQHTYGSDLICFGWCSDMHIPADGIVFEKNLGLVAAKVMDECNIPYFLMAGDTMTGDTGTTLSQIPDCYQKAWEYLSPIGIENVLSVKGNHDAWTSNDGKGNYYVYGLPPEEVNRLLFEPQAKDRRRVFGGTAYPVSCQMKDVVVYNIAGGGTKTAHLVPCYRKADNVIGMYDIVTDTFYTNIGSGTFTKGADVTE